MTNSSAWNKILFYLIITTTKDIVMQLDVYVTKQKGLVDEYLDSIMPPPDKHPDIIHKAMRYSLFANAKRLRPILTLASAESVGGNVKQILPIACALELIHTYSLIHDDLPVMDNDDLRRGKPTNHKVFGEAIAILAGDALLTAAFEALSVPEITDAIGSARQLKIINKLAKAAGSAGLIGGQVVDIQSQGKSLDIPELEYIHVHKTGKLILVSIISGAVAAGCSENQLAALSGYGEKLGLAYQIIDDILDVEGESAELGKNTGADSALHKATYPQVLGMKQAKIQAQLLISDAKADLKPLGDKARHLSEIADYILNRKN